MNNEDKIIDLLTTLTSDMYIVKASVSKLEAKVDNLEAGQAKLEAGQAILGAGQAKLEAELSDVKSIAQATHDNLAALENDYQSTRGALFTKLDILETKVDTLTEDVSVIKERLDTDEIYIRMLNKKRSEA